MIAYSLTILVITVLFWAGRAPVEQTSLFDVYYANTPYIREMIVTYLVALLMYLVAAAGAAVAVGDASAHVPARAPTTATPRSLLSGCTSPPFPCLSRQR